ATHLFSLYVKLPPGGATLRYPNRLFWITGLCLVMLAAIGIDGVATSAGRRGVRRPAAIVALLVSTALWAFTPGGLRTGELVLVSIVAAAVVGASFRSGLARPAAWLVAGAVVLNRIAVPRRSPGRLMPSADGLWHHADALAALRERMSAQDRALIESSLSSMFDLGLLVKSATVMRIPTVYDYEPLVGYRLGNYFSAMWHGSPITSGQALMTPPTVLPGYRRRLSALPSPPALVPPATARFPPPGAEFSAVEAGDPELRVFTALTALPRARFVSRVEVIDEPDTLLSRLAYGNDDLTAVALVEEPFPSGFAGER